MKNRMKLVPILLNTLMILIGSGQLLAEAPDYLKPPRGVSQAQLNRSFQSAVEIQTLYNSIYANCLPSIVWIASPVHGSINSKNIRPGLKGISYGTGFIIDKNGIIVTNHHVVGSASVVHLMLWDGRQVKGKVLGSDASTDVAVIKVSNVTGLHALPVGNSDKVKVGNIAIAIGNPHLLKNTMTIGVISAWREPRIAGNGVRILQTDAAINQGNSGGPLLNIRGEVIGINTFIVPNAKGGGSIGLGFAVPTNEVKTIIASIVRDGRFARPFLGVEISEVPAALRAKIGRSGAYIVGVMRGSGAHEAGIKPGDVVIKVNDREIKTPQELSNLVKKRNIGDSIRMDLIRSGRTLSVKARVKQLQKALE